MRVTYDEMFPTLRAVVLQNGHVDRITGPRCIVQMSEGPRTGLYFVAHTDEVLSAGTPVLVQTTDRMRARPVSVDPPYCEKCQWLHFSEAPCMDERLQPVGDARQMFAGDLGMELVEPGEYRIIDGAAPETPKVRHP